MKILLAMMVFGLASFTIIPTQKKGNDLVGAWQFTEGNQLMTAIFSEKYYAITSYNLKEKTFGHTYGGSWKSEGTTFTFTEEFNTTVPDNIGKEQARSFSIKNKKLLLPYAKEKQEWNRLDDGTPGKLAGAWLITGRLVDGNMQKMTPGARRTMKILSGTRFQWIAYNVETKEFSGTGGGTYKTENGKYIETIEFFSRDNSRVGKSLDFEFSQENGAWRHKGFSSKGDPIDEVWTKREQLGI